MSYIAKLLNKSGKASSEDQKIFRLWELRQLTTDECIEIFLENNKQPQGLYINPDEFEKWLHSLGYYQDMEV